MEWVSKYVESIDPETWIENWKTSLWSTFWESSQLEKVDLVRSYHYHHGSISSTCLRAAFTKAHSKTVDRLFYDGWLDCLFALLGSACVKAAHKHVDEIDPNSLKVSFKAKSCSLNDDFLLLKAFQSEFKKQNKFTWHFVDPPPLIVTYYLNGALSSTTLGFKKLSIYLNKFLKPISCIQILQILLSYLIEQVQSPNVLEAFNLWKENCNYKFRPIKSTFLEQWLQTQFIPIKIGNLSCKSSYEIRFAQFHLFFL